MILGPFRTSQAAACAGFRSRMMVDYLCRAGVVVPSVKAKPGRGSSRLYSFGDVVLLRAVNRLLSSGLPVSRLKNALRKQQQDFRHLAPETGIKRYLITDGQKVYLRENPEALVSLNDEGQMAFAFIIDVEHARRDVLRAVEKDRQRYRKATAGQK